MTWPAWKLFEARVAKALGGRRRGPDTTDPTGSGKSDCVETPGFAVECTLLGRPSYQTLLDKCAQAERNAGDLEMPVVVAKRKRDHDRNALVVMRFETWLAWNGPANMEGQQ